MYTVPLLQYSSNTTNDAYYNATTTTIGAQLLPRGGVAIVIRTHDVPKNPHIPLVLHTTLGPDYY